MSGHPTKGNTPHSSFRLSPRAKRLLAQLSRSWGVNKTAVLELLIRKASSQ